MSKEKLYSLIIFSVLILHIAASYYSVGWYNPDEQSCVLEYLLYKIDKFSDPCFIYLNDQNEIYEGIKIRSWSQPFIYFIITKFLFIFYKLDGFTLTFILKLFSSLIGFLSMIIFFRSSKSYELTKSTEKIYFLTFFLFWFYPFLHSRTSSENLSIAFLFLSISLCIKIMNNKNYLLYFLMGILMGLTFIFRYHLGISIFFILLWILIYSKTKFQIRVFNLFFTSLGIFSIILLELLINIWGYGGLFNFNQISFPAYGIFNYSSSNNFFSNEMWTTDPFWNYLELSLTKFYPPISILIIVSMFYFWVKGRYNLLTWATLPFFIIHSLIPHKELRYIFPVLAFSPYFISFFYEKYLSYRELDKNKYIKSIIIFLFLLNILGLFFVSFTPQKPQLKVLNYIYKNYDNINEIYYFNNLDNIDEDSLNPFNLKNLTTNYYFRFTNIELFKINKNEKIRFLSGYSGFCPKTICYDIERKYFKTNNLEYHYFKKNSSIPSLKIYLRDPDNNEIVDFNNLNFYIDLNNLNFYMNGKKLYILTKDYEIYNKLLDAKKCSKIISSYPNFISKISKNRINQRLTNYGFFQCL